MVLEITLREAIQLLAAINLMQQSTAARKVKFGYMLAYNRRLLEAVKEDAMKTISTDAENSKIQEFEKDRVAAFEVASEKGPDGQALVVDGAYKVIGGEDAIKKIQEDLNVKHPGIIALLEERSLKEKELLLEKQELDLRLLPISEWPDVPDDIDPSVMNYLYKLVLE